MKITFSQAVTLLSVLMAHAACAQSSADAEKQAYCDYVEAEAKAERTLDTGIEAYAQAGQTQSDSSKQAVIGLQKSLSRHLQGVSATRVAVLQCELYRVRLDVDRATRFQLASINQRIAQMRVDDLKNVLSIVDEELAATQKRRNAGNATVADVLALTQQRQALFAQYRAAQTEIAAQVVPELPALDLSRSLSEIDAATVALRDEMNHKAELQTWDVALLAGVQTPFGAPPVGTSTRTRPYAALTASYNLNASAYRRQLGDATTSLIEMQHQQNDEIFQKVHALQTVMANSRKAEQDNLPALEAAANSLNDQYTRIRYIDSPEALKIRAGIRINLAVAEMELHIARYRITLLSNDYAKNN
jgi:uncharacterized protein YigA (DUF484 family)